MLKQLSIYAENKKGVMQNITGILKNEDINILGSVTNDSAEYGIVRMVVSDPDKAKEALIAAGSACVKAQDSETAKNLYEEALNSGKTGEKLESRIYNQLGLCQMAEEDYETAADTFDKGYNALITGYKAGTGAELDQAAAAIPKEDTQGLTLLKELAYNKAVCLEYRQQYRQAQAEFETYIKVFGDDEDARHEIDFLKTRQEE